MNADTASGNSSALKDNSDLGKMALKLVNIKHSSIKKTVLAERFDKFFFSHNTKIGSEL